MLDGGSFFATALALVGFAPARELNRREPNLALIPDVPASRPTTTESPYRELALMPVDKPQNNKPISNTGTNARPKLASKGSLSDIDAIRFFVADWLDACGETVTLLDELLKSYAAFRKDHPELPELSKVKLSKRLAAAGCVRLVRVLPRNGKDERGKRLVMFEMRAPRQAHRRAAA